MYNHGRKQNHPILPLVCSHDPCEVEMELLVQVENHHPHDDDDSTSPCQIVEGLKVGQASTTAFDFVFDLVLGHPPPSTPMSMYMRTQ